MPDAGAPAPRIDLSAIEDALRSTQRSLAALHEASGKVRDVMGEPVVENMLAGYARVGELVARGIDPFAMGAAAELLELNRLVLCGTDPGRRARYAGHFAATEQRFYDERDAGIGDLVESHELAAGLPVWERAAGAYIRIQCKPQLFIEGNHRTGTLILGCVLLQGGMPPFVLNAANADAYFAASAGFRDLRKHSLTAFVRLPGMRKRFAEFLRRESHSEYLRHG